MKNSISCIIVDDEKEAREGLKLMVSEIDDIELMDICKNGIEAVEKINEFRPDLILLDIQMPYLDGFEVLQHIKHQPPAIIFITAYDDYALKAFEVNAIDYLLKPFNDFRFNKAINAAREKIRYRKKDNYNFLIKSSKTTPQDAVVYEKETRYKSERMVIKSDGKLHFIPLNDIIWIEAFDYYIKVHTQNSFYLVRETMKKMESKLPEKNFIRIHKSSIVNMDHIVRVEYSAGAEVQIVIADDQTLKVSRSYKGRVLEKIKKWVKL